MADFVNTVDVVGDVALTNSIIDRSITEIVDDTIETLNDYAFYGCSSLTEAHFPNVTTLKNGVFQNCSTLVEVDIPRITQVPNNAFRGCSALTEANFPVATIVGYNAFYGCYDLSTLNLPEIKTIGDHAFYGCSSLTEVHFPNVTKLDYAAFVYCTKLKKATFEKASILESHYNGPSGVFQGCSKLEIVDFSTQITEIHNSTFGQCSMLKAVILRADTMSVIDSADAFIQSGINFGTGYIYVPAALVDSYKADANWSECASQIRALEEYTVDGTTTGELDETKI